MHPHLLPWVVATMAEVEQTEDALVSVAGFPRLLVTIEAQVSPLVRYSRPIIRDVVS